jgi:anti-sigma factor (TIGR02949 family)
MNHSPDNAGAVPNCDQAMLKLFELLDGELTPEIERRVRSHITSCPDCFTHADFEQRFLSALQAAKKDGGSTPATCRKKVMSALREAGFTG